MNILNLPPEYERCFAIISERFRQRLPGVTVRFEKSAAMTVGYDGVEGYIKCDRINRFARLFGIFIERYNGESFEVREDAAFETVGCMLDLSFGSAPTVESIFEFCDYAALLGYSQIWLYMEDMYEIKERPYFGYLRGRYSFDELKAIDDHAYSLGIEAVPCIQTLGHLKNYLCWPEAAAITEGPAIMPMNLLPDCEQTYEFVEQMIVNSTAPFRSKKIHIGCDETAGLGLGKYLKLNGYSDQFDLYIRHVNRVVEICKKHCLLPMMWGDMFVSYASKRGDNYDRDAVISEKIKSSISRDVRVVFWHYGQHIGCEEYMLDKYFELSGSPIFAGGARSWQSPLTDNYFSLKAAEASLSVCKKKGVKDVCLTLWTYVTSIYQTTYLALCHFAELSYGNNAENLRERFEFLTGASYDAFMKMSNFNDLYDSEEAIAEASYKGSGRGNRYFISDLLLNVLDKDLIDQPRSGYYKKTADFFREYAEDKSEWNYLYGYALAIFDMLGLKCEIAEKLVPAYGRRDRQVLEEIRDILLPGYLEKLEKISRLHSYHKDTYLRPFGTENRDQVYGGMKERAKTAMRRIGMYLDGKVDKIGELEEQRLPYVGGPLVTVVPKIYY